jgi:hypothetical protein
LCRGAIGVVSLSNSLLSKAWQDGSRAQRRRDLEEPGMNSILM